MAQILQRHIRPIGNSAPSLQCVLLCSRHGDVRHHVLTQAGHVMTGARHVTMTVVLCVPTMLTLGASGPSALWIAYHIGRVPSLYFHWCR